MAGFWPRPTPLDSEDSTAAPPRRGIAKRTNPACFAPSDDSAAGSWQPR
jgi:hypothetical protein